jgi:hypothetical protein
MMTPGLRAAGGTGSVNDEEPLPRCPRRERMFRNAIDGASLSRWSVKRPSTAEE